VKILLWERGIKLLLTEIKNSVGIITISRPEVHNAINLFIMNQFSEILEQFEEDPSVKMVIITGAGTKYFCSGGDIAEFHHLDQKGSISMLHQMKDILNRIQTFPKPTVALLNGSALGGGCELASSCDFRLAHPEVEIGFIQIKLGITTGWGGATRLFTKIASTKAFRTLLTGKRMSAHEALSMGFIDELLNQDTLLEDALSWCEEITVHSLPSILSYKHTLLDQLDPSLSMKERLDREVERSGNLWGSKEHKEIVQSFLNKKNKK